VKDLTLEVRPIDDVGVDDPEVADARGREVHRDRRAEPAGADDQHARLLESALTICADAGKDEVAAVPSQLFGAEWRGVSGFTHARNIP
jgi:hypothetical protein